MGNDVGGHGHSEGKDGLGGEPPGAIAYSEFLSLLRDAIDNGCDFQRHMDALRRIDDAFNADIRARIMALGSEV